MNWRTWAPLVLAAILGLIAAKAGRDLINRSQRSGATVGSYTTVVVAKTDLAPGYSLGAGDVATTTVTSDNSPRTAFRRTSDVVGRVLILPVVQGQPILEGFLAAPGAGPGPQAMVPAGMRALSIEVSESSGVAGLLVPGCHVDVVCTLQDAKNQPVARMIVQNAKVLAVGQRLLMGAKKEGEDGGRAKSVTLLVAPRDVEMIELAGSAGKVRLVLRGSLDDAKSLSEGATVAELLGPSRNPPQAIVRTEPQSPPAAPVKTASVRSVEVIRAGKSERVDLPTGSLPDSALTGDPTHLGPLTPDRSP